MDPARQFSMRQLVGIGVLSGVTVSVVKLIQLSIRLNEVSAVDVWAALVTYLGYMFLGAMGAVFLVDHDAKGQKMLKSAFLMGFVAPSFFLALLNQPITPGTNLRDMINRVPKITEFFISSAHAQNKPWEATEKLPENSGKHILVLDKWKVQPTFGLALWKAVGGNVVPASYAYVIGATEDPAKALRTAMTANKILSEAGQSDYIAKVIQPAGQHEYYVALGDFGTPDKAVRSSEVAKSAALKGLEGRETEEAKRVATLMLKGQIVDARAMFVAQK